MNIILLYLNFCVFTNFIKFYFTLFLSQHTVALVCLSNWQDWQISSASSRLWWAASSQSIQSRGHSRLLLSWERRFWNSMHIAPMANAISISPILKGYEHPQSEGGRAQEGGRSDSRRGRRNWRREGPQWRQQTEHAHTKPVQGPIFALPIRLQRWRDRVRGTVSWVRRSVLMGKNHHFLSS